MTHPTYKITDEMLRAAAKIDDVDLAVGSVMEQVGITDGTQASYVFSGRYYEDWPTADHEYRMHMLQEWVNTEQAFINT